MDGQDILFESILKVEKGLMPPVEGFLEPTKPQLSNEDVEEECKDLCSTSTLKSVIKKEENEEELEPPVAVFFEATEFTKEEVEEECEDPLATCVESFRIKTEETDECSCSVGDILGVVVEEEEKRETISPASEMIENDALVMP